MSSHFKVINNVINKLKNRNYGRCALMMSQLHFKVVNNVINKLKNRKLKTAVDALSEG